MLNLQLGKWEIAAFPPKAAPLFIEGALYQWAAAAAGTEVPADASVADLRNYPEIRSARGLLIVALRALQAFVAFLSFD